MEALHASNGNSSVEWDPKRRIAAVKYTAGATLTAADGVLLVEALKRWVGEERRPFGVLADAKGLKSTDIDYRSVAGDFFKVHHEAHIAIVNMGPVIRVVVDLFRVGTGVSLKAFANETDARAWLSSNGIEA